MLDIAQQFCDYVPDMQKGKFVAEGSLDELREQEHAFLGSSLEDVFLELTEDGHEQDDLGSLRFVFFYMCAS